MDLILEKHPHAKLIIPSRFGSMDKLLFADRREIQGIARLLLMTQRYGATLNTPRITTVYQENTDAKSQVDMLQFMKGFNVKLCYYYEYGVKEDIEFIRNLFPQTENIAIISDNSYAGLSQMKYVENEIAEHFPDLQIIHIDGRTMDMAQARQAMKNLPERTAAMLCVWRYDSKRSLT